MTGDVRWSGEYRDPLAALRISDAIVDQLSTWCNPWLHVPALVTVGEPRVVADALGPLVAAILQERGFAGPVAGTPEAPVLTTTWRAESAGLWERSVRTCNRWPFIVAVDAALGEPGCITVREGPLLMGEGNPELADTPTAHRQVGDISILGCTSERGDRLDETPMELVREMALVIADGLMSAWERWETDVSTEMELAAAAGQD